MARTMTATKPAPTAVTTGSAPNGLQVLRNLLDMYGRPASEMSIKERAEAITGYDLKQRIEALVSGITGQKIKHIYAGSGAATAPGMMLLPRIAGTLLFSPREVYVILGYTAHELSHQLHTDFDLVRSIFADIEKPTTREQQIKEFWNGIEDYRIERESRKRYPGFPILINETRDHTARRFVEQVDAGLIPEAGLSNPYRIGSVALTWVGARLNRYATQAPAEALLRIPEPLRGWLESWDTEMSAIVTCDDARVLAIRILDEIDRMRENPPEEEPKGDEEGNEGEQSPQNGLDCGDGNNQNDDSQSDGTNPSDGEAGENEGHGAAQSKSGKGDAGDDAPESGDEDGTDDADPSDAGDAAGDGDDSDEGAETGRSGAKEGKNAADDGGDKQDRNNSDDAPNGDKSDDRNTDDDDGSGGASADKEEDDKSIDKNGKGVGSGGREDQADDGDGEGGENSQGRGGDDEKEEDASGAGAEGGDPDGSGEERPENADAGDAGQGGDEDPGKNEDADGEGDPSESGAEDGDEQDADSGSPSPSTPSGAGSSSGSGATGGQTGASQKTGGANVAPGDGAGSNGASPQNERPRPDIHVAEGDQDEKAEEADLAIDELIEAINEACQGMREAETPEIHDPKTVAQSEAGDDYDDDDNLSQQRVSASGVEKYTMLRQQLSSAAARTAGVVRRMLQSRNRTRTRSGLEDGNLDFGRLVPMALGSSDVYRQTRTTPQINTALTLLLDNSGSMSGHPLHLCQQTGIVLDMSVQGTPTALEILGFTSGPRGTRIYQYRTFEQKGVSSAASLGNMDAVELGGTPVGTPVMEAWRRLRQRKEPRKIMIVVSDGGAEDPIEALAAARIVEMQGGTVVGIAIGADEYMKKWCEKVVPINDVEELPQALAQIVQEHLSR